MALTFVYVYVYVCVVRGNCLIDCCVVFFAFSVWEGGSLNPCVCVCCAHLLLYHVQKTQDVRFSHYRSPRAQNPRQVATAPNTNAAVASANGKTTLLNQLLFKFAFQLGFCIYSLLLSVVFVHMCVLLICILIVIFYCTIIINN